MWAWDRDADHGARTLQDRAGRYRNARRAPLFAVAELLQRSHVVAPGFAHAHPQLEEHAAVEHAFHRAPRRAADLLELGSAGADHDALLSFALDPHDRTDARDVGRILEALDLDRCRIGQLGTELQN